MGNINGIDTTPSDVAMASIEALPFGDIIGGPLKACIEAQTNAAMATWQEIIELYQMLLDPRLCVFVFLIVRFSFFIFNAWVRVVLRFDNH